MSDTKGLYYFDSASLGQKKDPYYLDPFASQEFSSSYGRAEVITLDCADRDSLFRLFADKGAFDLKERQLKADGRCRARISVPGSQPYWADIETQCGKIIIRNADMEQNFLIDGEDLLEEMERTGSKMELYRGALC